MWYDQKLYDFVKKAINNAITNVPSDIEKIDQEFPLYKLLHPIKEGDLAYRRTCIETDEKSNIITIFGDIVCNVRVYNSEGKDVNYELTVNENKTTNVRYIPRREYSYWKINILDDSKSDSLNKYSVEWINIYFDSYISESIQAMVYLASPNILIYSYVSIIDDMTWTQWKDNNLPLYISD